MIQLQNYLQGLRGDIFKLLPMKEDEIEGVDNHIEEYIESLLVTMRGAMATYPAISTKKKYLYVINNLQYLKTTKMRFEKWRTIVLNSGSEINNLLRFFGGGENE